MPGPALQKTLWTLPLLAGLGTAMAADAPTGYTAQLFAPGVISTAANDWTPTFTPDGKTAYLWRSGLSWGFILESHQTGAGWSEPVIAPFSGEYPDSSPVMAPDGSYMVFESQQIGRAHV